MIENEITLFDRLNDIVDEAHICEVKKIISTLSKIDKLKDSIESDISAETLYNKISTELKIEFNIDKFKIIHVDNNTETILYKAGEIVPSYNYAFKNTISKNIQINNTNVH